LNATRISGGMEPEKAVDAEVADSWFAADCWFSVGTRNFLFALSRIF
jgi:hypothetical protein